MRRNINVLFIVFVLALLVAPRNAVAAVEDTIVAVVNDDVITLNDLKDYIDSQVAQMKLEGTSPGELKEFMEEMERNGLERIIDDKIILNAANKKDIKVEDEMVDRRVDGIRAQYKSEDEFVKALLEEGVSITDIRKKIVNQIKTKRLIDEEIRSKIYVNPQEVTEYYKNHFEEYQKPERVNLDSVFIAKDGAPDQALAKAKEALAKLKEGKDFKDIAKEYSQSPSVGVMKKGQALPEIEKTVFALNTGEISDICEVANGYYIFKLLGHSPKELAAIDEVKDDIYNKIFQQKFREKFNIWLEKLKKDAFIDIKKHVG